jgi:hypothetical protein
VTFFKKQKNRPIERLYRQARDKKELKKKPEEKGKTCMK